MPKVMKSSPVTCGDLHYSISFRKKHQFNVHSRSPQEITLHVFILNKNNSVRCCNMHIITFYKTLYYKYINICFILKSFFVQLKRENWFKEETPKAMQNQVFVAALSFKGNIGLFSIENESWINLLSGLSKLIIQVFQNFCHIQLNPLVNHILFALLIFSAST